MGLMAEKDPYIKQRLNLLFCSPDRSLSKGHKAPALSGV